MAGKYPYNVSNAQKLSDRDATIMWARGILKTASALQVVILDSETTDIQGEIIDLAITDFHTGAVLVNRRFKPLGQIAEGAARVHGLTLDRLANEPSWAEHYEEIEGYLTNARTILIYNAPFDIARLNQTCKLHERALINLDHAQDVMIPYSRFIGEWNSYHHDYRWQKLPGGDHTALGDCISTRQILLKMAKAELSYEQS